MKKLLVSALTVAFLFPALAFGDKPLSTYTRARTAYVEDAASATPTILAAASGVTYTILGYIVSASSADNIYFRCGATQKTAKVYFAANSGLYANFSPFYIQCAAGEAFNMTKGTAATPVSVTVFYLDSNQ